MKYPDRYVITGIVEKGDDKGRKVFLGWTEEGGGWWQWSLHKSGANRFTDTDNERFKDAIRCATGKTWTKSTCGPWYYMPDISSVKVEEVPAIVKVTVR